MRLDQIVQALGASHAALSGGNIAAAERLLAPVLSAAPQHAKALYLQGLIRNAQGRVAESAALMRQALKIAPADHECWNSLGSLYFRQGQFDPAAACFRQALGCNGRYWQARLNLVRALLGLERFNEAEKEARLLLTQAPSTQAHVVLGNALRCQGQYDAALCELDRALQLTPDDVTARHDRAIVLDKAGCGEAAVAEYARLHAEGLQAPELFRNWAGALLDLGRNAESEQKLIQALTLYPHDATLNDNLARLRWVTTGAPDFARDYVAVVRAQPDNTRLRIGCSDLLRRSGQLEEARSMLREGLARSANEPALLGALGVVLGELDDLGGAEQVLKQALPARSGDWRFTESLVEVLIRAGKPDEAIPHILGARAALPLDQAWIAQHATALAVMGDPGYRHLYDFQRMVRAAELPTPQGYGAAFNAELIERLHQLHSLHAHPIDQSLVNGTQTSKSLLESRDPVIQAFLHSVEDAMAAFVATMPDEPSHPFWGRKPSSGRIKLVGCWSVRLRQGGYHVNHVHPEGWISSAYYVVVPPETQGANDHQGWIKFGEPRRPTQGVEAGHFVQPRTGWMAMFPSYMWHGTVPFEKGAERMTIAMDAIPVS